MVDRSSRRVALRTLRVVLVLLRLPSISSVIGNVELTCSIPMRGAKTWSLHCKTSESRPNQDEKYDSLGSQSPQKGGVTERFLFASVAVFPFLVQVRGRVW